MKKLLCCFLIFLLFSASANWKSSLTHIAILQLNKPYYYAHEGPSSFDCSGLVYYCVQKSHNIILERTAKNQANDNSYKKIENIEDLQQGDLLYFYSSRKSHTRINHAGIYLCNGRFIHCSSVKGKVVISTLLEGTYHDRFGWARRLKGDDINGFYKRKILG